jgi:hypothetical protein
MSRQKSVESLLIEVRDEYGRSMKKAVIDHRRADPREEVKMEHLRLPPRASIPPVPFSAVVSMPAMDNSLGKIISLIENAHFTIHPETTQVVLATFKSWQGLNKGRFIATAPETLPMTLYEYQDYQDAHFTNLRDRIVHDWRSLVVDLIRDNLSNVFQLFVNDPVEFEESELKRFLKMLTLMLRDQLSSLVPPFPPTHSQPISISCNLCAIFGNPSLFSVVFLYR